MKLPSSSIKKRILDGSSLPDPYRLLEASLKDDVALLPDIQ